MTRSEQGVGTTLTLCMAAVLLTVGWVVAGAVAMSATQHRAAAAADLAALAGADAEQDGRPACAAAEQVARANSTRLVSCVEVSGTVHVQVAAESVRLLGRRWESVRTARAGPAGGLSGE